MERDRIACTATSYAPVWLHNLQPHFVSLSLSLSLGLSLKEINLKLEFCKYEEQSDTDTDTDTVTSWKFRLYSLVLNNCSYEGGRHQFTCLLLCTVKCFFSFVGSVWHFFQK